MLFELAPIQLLDFLKLHERGRSMLALADAGICTTCRMRWIILRHPPPSPPSSFRSAQSTPSRSAASTCRSEVTEGLCRRRGDQPAQPNYPSRCPPSLRPDRDSQTVSFLPHLMSRNPASILGCFALLSKGSRGSISIANGRTTRHAPAARIRLERLQQRNATPPKPASPAFPRCCWPPGSPPARALRI
jgi:hypothetical protein